MAVGANQPRGQRQLALIFMIGFVPMLVAAVMYFAGWGIPEGRTNQGVLLDPIRGVGDFELTLADGAPFTSLFVPAREEGKWQLLLLAPDCAAADCGQALYTLRQVNVALGRDAPRVHRAAWLGEAGDDVLEQYPQMRALQGDAGHLQANAPGLAGAPYQIYIVDPLGNVVLRYGPQHDGDALLEDLEHLLKLSNIG